MNRTHYKFNNHLDTALILKFHENTSANKDAVESCNFKYFLAANVAFLSKELILIVIISLSCPSS